MEISHFMFLFPTYPLPSWPDDTSSSRFPYGALKQKRKTFHSFSVVVC